MGVSATSWVTLTLVLAAAHYGAAVCHVHNYVSSCIIDILEEHIEATAIINHCHVPLDITFLIVYQYRNSTRHSWKYTFVTSNQNERVLIPGLLLPIAPSAPVFLYARVPEQEFNMHNNSFVAIKASFIAELDRDKWEEADFLNHTVILSPSSDCRFTRDGQDPIPWIIGGLFAVALLSGLLGGGYFLYRRRKQAADQLALMSSMEVGMPGAQPYQMDVVEQNKVDESSDQETIKRNGVSSSDAQDSTPTTEDRPKKQGTPKEEQRNGRKGFKFGRLKEDESYLNDNTGLKDTSIIIANPAYQEEHHIMQKQIEMNDGSQEPIILGLSSQEQNPTIERGIVNRMYQEDEAGNQEVLSEEAMSDDHQLEDDDSLEGSGQVGQGAKRKVRGTLSSSCPTTTETVDADDSREC